MKVSNIRIEPRPEGRVRLLADVSYQRAKQNETIWFEVDDIFGSAISLDADPWICCLLPLAALWGEIIEVDAYGSRELVEHAYQISSVWRGWYPNLRPFNIAVKGFSDKQAPEAGQSGVFFSGGVDSFFTALHVANDTPPLDLIQVWGFDIPLSNRNARDGRYSRTQRLAQEWNKDLIEVATNLRLTMFRFANWGRLSHGCALAAVAHALSNRLNCILISASYDNRSLIPWASHPVIDPLLGSEKMRIIHYGAAFRRIDKIAFLTNHQIALDNLHVCYKEGDDKNCGVCEKCLRTMVALDLFGKLCAARSFPATTEVFESYTKTDFTSRGSRIFAEEIAQLAIDQGCVPAADKIQLMIRKGRRTEILTRVFSTRYLIEKLRVKFPGVVNFIRQVNGRTP